MIYLKTFEGLFDFFKKKPKTEKEKISDILRKLIDDKIVTVYRSGRIPKHITDNYERMWWKNEHNLPFYYRVNDDLSLDIFGDVLIKNFNGDKFPICFKFIEGYLIIRHCAINETNDLVNVDVDDYIEIQNYRGPVLPFNFKFCTNSFTLKNTHTLTTLKNFPKRVYGTMKLTGNSIKSIEDLNTEYVDGDFKINDNKLTSLVGMPKVTGRFLVYNNKIINYDGVESYEEFTNIEYGNNPIWNLTKMLFRSNKSHMIFDLFKEYDPIHPGLVPENKAIIYTDRLNDLTDSVKKKRIDLETEEVKTYYELK